MDKIVGNIKEWVKSKVLLCLFLADILLTIIFIIGYGIQTSDLISLEFSKEQLESYTTGQSVGGKIDTGYTNGIYDIIPDIFLEKGQYRYTVYYEGAAPGSICWPHTYVEFHDVIEQVTVALDGKKTEEVRTFWLNADLNIALRLLYNGAGEATFTGFKVEELNTLAKLQLFNRLLLLAGANLLFWLIKRGKKKPLPNGVRGSVIALIAVAMVASFPSLTGYTVDGHDIRFHMARIEGIYEGLLAGQFPVRIAPTFYNGYGYANPIFYGELLLYFPAALRLIGFSVADSYNALLILLNVLTAFICYYCGKKLFQDDTVAVVTALLYVLCPYRMMDMYTRAAIGEVCGMVFLPLVAYGLYRVLTEDTAGKSYGWAHIPLVIGLTGIVQSHVITGEMVGGVILLACVLYCFKTLQKKRFCALVKTVVETVLINAWFLVPFIDFTLTQDVRVFATASTDLIQGTGVYLPQLFSMFSDYAQLSLGAGSGVASEMPISMGLSLGLGMLLFVAMVWYKDETQHIRKMHGVCFLILAVITAWMATLYFPWDKLSTTISFATKLISSLQFTWRFLGVAACLAAIVTGFGLYLLNKQVGKSGFMAVAAVLTTLAVVSVMDYNQVILFNKNPMDINENSFKTDNNSYYAMAGEYVLCDVRYEVVTEIFEPRGSEGVLVSDYEKEGTNIRLTVSNDATEGYVLLPLLNYKGYTVTSEDGSIGMEQLQMGEGAVIQLNIPAGYTGTISVRYDGMWYWRVAEAVSLATIVYMAFAHFKVLKKHTKEENVVYEQGKKGQTE